MDALCAPVDSYCCVIHLLRDPNSATHRLPSAAHSTSIPGLLQVELLQVPRGVDPRTISKTKTFASKMMSLVFALQQEISFR